MTIHVTWAQPNKVNMNEIDYVRWNEWDGLWTEGNNNETWSMKCGLKEMRWNMNDEVGNVTAHCRLGSQNKWWGIYILVQNKSRYVKSSKIEFDKEVILIYWCYYW